ncbi:MAG: 5-deoxy-glucuronate isomerase [Anaerolineaceae bacterium]|nr:5-deoxy-glucuronate isomerase [Anaerolineaceae bacterium]
MPEHGLDNLSARNWSSYPPHKHDEE